MSFTQITQRDEASEVINTVCILASDQVLKFVLRKTNFIGISA